MGNLGSFAADTMRRLEAADYNQSRLIYYALLPFLVIEMTTSNGREERMKEEEDEDVRCILESMDTNYRQHQKCR